ncbi:deoxyribonuclease IV [Candidatus Stoquefichus massiliensis]|uniref:deoxyribonuclease IV n=1 Tax=Candidatus Stoquefichus massiliensis TaxID=1470350 RepID=UPI000489C4FE|nr:deoxyribonuclease IV [Candidatus Stoquefichus massiliensis]
MLKIGSHVSMSGKEMMLGSVKEALSYGSTTFMFYTGAPQNTARKPIDQLRIDEAKELMSQNNIDINDVVIHAPYIINLANTLKLETFDLAVRFLKQEIERCEAIGVSRLVLHPGSHVKAGDEAGLQQIVKGLNEVLTENQKVHIALETMAGKGSELGRDFDQIQYMIENVKYNHLLGVCLDTCHLHDAGYDLTKFDDLLNEFDEKIGIDRLLVVHVNDSKNEQGAHKDRHENIGYGYIGFETLNTIVHHPKLKDVPKILETPYIGDHAPYKEEIEMFINQTFNNGLK